MVQIQIYRIKMAGIRYIWPHFVA
ncbi:hypothetical protein BLA29_013300 [Euroglyphus maynei]|uniref:Uncharacterized protein n=1 Tax=Euroglyphus maynei TaxID=6958 RepID=A0A1Y3BP10_EURMA|nr:hypothetical protein BLA29_013300 [Euroglyphus maynei]